MHTQISATNRVIPYVKKSHVLTQLFHCNFSQNWDTNWDIKTEKSPLEQPRRDFCGDSRNRIDTAFSPTGLYKSLFYAEEMQV